MIATIINDCRDQNALTRQAIRTSSLLGCPTHSIGVTSDLEASGNLVDALDAAGNAKHMLLVNVAPRNGRGKKWSNGTPFCYFTSNNTIVISSVDGHTLSLAKKFGLLNKMHLVDIPTTLDFAINKRLLTEDLRDRITNSQFRSFDFLPRLGKWLVDNVELPHEPYNQDEIAGVDHCIWWVDSFGNCKTTVLPEEIGFTPGKKVQTAVGEVNCYARLKDVPNDEVALVIGSSGYQNNRFLELVIQGGSAAQAFQLKSGLSVGVMIA